MFILWFIALVAAIVAVVAFAAWLASRRRISIRTGPFRCQDGKTPPASATDSSKQEGAQTTPLNSKATVPVPSEVLKGVSGNDESTQLSTSNAQKIDSTRPTPDVDKQVVKEGESLAVEELGIRDESSKVEQELTSAVDLCPQGDDRLDLNDKDANIKDESKQRKEPEHREQTGSPAEASSAVGKQEERPDETDISSRVQEETLISESKTEIQPDHLGIDDDEPATAKKRSPTERKHPPKYQPTIRTPETTKRNKRQEESEKKGSRTRSLKMFVHIVFGLRKKCRVSLLPTRSGDLGEDMEVRGPKGKETWSVYQDEWYSSVLPPNIDKLLKQGGIWEHPGAQTRWVLSSREIYVLAPSSTINGYVSVPRLILGEDHLVLCTKDEQAAVREALAEAGCFQTTTISDDGSVPTGWVLFESVFPTIPIQDDHEAGIYNILRPLHDLEIVLKGGIRISHSTWLNGYPPHIRIRGVGEEEPEVMIDEKPASTHTNGNYSSSGWDKPGLHTVYAGGVTQSYELGDGVQEWSLFDAFVYRPSFAETSDRAIRICGPIVAPNTGDGDVSLTPSTNTCFLGAIPGQIAFSPRPNDVRSSEFLAVAGFPLVWTLPTNPHGSDRSLACVKLIRSQHVVLKHNRAFFENRKNVLRWCYKILEASCKRLRIIPDTVESHELWTDYKRAARRLRKRLR